MVKYWGGKFILCFMAIAAILPKKSLTIAHVNICSLRNKVDEMNHLLFSNTINIFAISETHLEMKLYNLYRNDRGRYGGGIAFYVQNQILVKVREDIMCKEIEVLWLQVN